MNFLLLHGCEPIVEIVGLFLVEAITSEVVLLVEIDSSLEPFLLHGIIFELELLQLFSLIICFLDQAEKVLDLIGFRLLVVADLLLLDLLSLPTDLGGFLTSNAQLVLSGNFVLLFFKFIDVFLVNLLLSLGSELPDSFFEFSDLLEESLELIILLSHLFFEGFSSSSFVVKLTGS